MNHGVALTGSTSREDVINADRRVEKATIIAREDIREDAVVCASSLLSGGLHDHLRGFDHALSTVAEVTLTPRVRLANDIEGKGAELAACNLAKLRKRLTLNIVANLLRVPARLGITKTSLAIDAEAPLVEITTFGKGSCVTEAS